MRSGKDLRFFIYAVNVHQGGGAVLLDAVLTRAGQKGISCTTFLDSRFRLKEPVAAGILTHNVEPRIVSRLWAERSLRARVTRDDVVLCFGNLPPLYRLEAPTILFIQNRYLIDSIPLRSLAVKMRMRIAFERVWLRALCKNVDCVVVQTPTMQECVRKSLGMKAQVFPFMEKETLYSRMQPDSDVQESRYDFLYVASAEPHKNHFQLVKAWIMLAEEGIYPILCLTLDEKNDRKLVAWIYDRVQQHGLKIFNAGWVSQTELAKLYRQAKALIYPSNFEAFGLPLIEARNANLAIIASERDYVRDILDPEETFEPSSPKSIARAVKRFLGRPEQTLPVSDALSFIEFCINSSKMRNTYVH